MALDGVQKQEFNVRNLPTRSVTLYPTRAEVVRDINDISLEVCLAPIMLSQSAD